MKTVVIGEPSGATEQLRFSNDDGSIHVVELPINGAIFHMADTEKNIVR